jgi:acyl-CoA thioesterase-1
MRNLGSLGIVTIAVIAVVGGACGSSSPAKPGDGGPTDGGPSDGGPSDGPVPLAVTHPNPLISRSGHVYPATAGNLIEGNYHVANWNVGTTFPSSAAIKLTVGTPGPTRLLLSWDDGGTYNYQDPTTATVYGFPGAYTIETSANSTTGTDGDWHNVVTVTGNQVRTRAHSFGFTGMTWVRMTVTAAPPNESSNGVQLGQIDIHDISATPTGLPDDTWFFMGDSITAFAFDRALAHQPSFAAAINTAFPSYFPAMINGGIGGEKSSDGLARLAADLQLNPDFRFFLLGYGTNDAAGDQVPVATFQSNMQSMIDMVKSAGRIPIMPHIPYSGDGSHDDIPTYNAAIDALTASNGLLTGPDFYAYFMTNAATDFMCGCSGGRTTDNLHPNDVGLQEMNTLWATDPAITALYH